MGATYKLAGGLPPASFRTVLLRGRDLDAWQSQIPPALG
jgi:hypothetical protein